MLLVQAKATADSSTNQMPALTMLRIMISPGGYVRPMDPITLVFLIIAAVLFALAAFGFAVSRINLVAAGLLSLVLAQLLPPLLR
jgi:hypothetical protein